MALDSFLAKFSTTFESRYSHLLLVSGAVSRLMMSTDELKVYLRCYLQLFKSKFLIVGDSTSILINPLRLFMIYRNEMICDLKSFQLSPKLQNFFVMNFEFQGQPVMSKS